MAMSERYRSKAPKILLEKEEARGHQAKKARRLNVLQFPILRLVGFLLLLAAAGLHNRYILAAAEPLSLRLPALLFLSYCALSWCVLAVAYGRTGRLDLGVFFLACDLPLWTVGIYCSGGEYSWLFFILTLRVADQTHTSMRRALLFGHIGAFCYLGMLFYIANFEQRPVHWPAGLTKAFFIYSANFYIALAAQTAEGLRRRMVEAIRVARRSIRKLSQQSEQLEKAMHRAEQASQAKSEFLAMISHELRTPMAGVIGTTDLLLRSDPKAEQLHYLETIKGSSEALLTIIDEILDFTRLESGSDISQEENFQIRDVLAEASDLLRPSAQAKGIQIRLQIEDTVPATSRGDAGRLRQVLINLVGNAIKYSQEGTVQIRARLTTGSDENKTAGSRNALEDQAAPRYLRIAVEDEGIGISEQVREELFEPFFQVDRSMSREYSGTGLGLAIAKRLVVAMGGQIGYHSNLGKGSTFWLTLPLLQPSDSATATLEETLDLQRLSTILGEEKNSSLLLQWIELFVRDGRGHLASLRRLRKQEDFPGVAETSERLRDECMGLGAKTLSVAYDNLAEAAKSGTSEGQDRALEELDAQFDAIESALSGEGSSEE